MGMKNLDRDAVSRSLDYNDRMERINKPEGDFKYPIGALALLAMLAFFLYQLSVWIRS